MSPCLEQQMVSLVEYTRDERRKLLDACKEYRSQLDEANRRIDELQSRLSAAEAARDDATSRLFEVKSQLDWHRRLLHDVQSVLPPSQPLD